MQVAALFFRMVEEEHEQRELEFEEWWSRNRHDFPDVPKNQAKKIWIAGTWRTG